MHYANFVKLPHTLFALPFAFVGVVLASELRPVHWSQVVWVTLAFTAARFAAMGFNRVVDRDLDALNPRTARREIPAGLIGAAEAAAAVALASAALPARGVDAESALLPARAGRARSGSSSTATRSASRGSPISCSGSGSASRRWAATSR